MKRLLSMSAVVLLMSNLLMARAFTAVVTPDSSEYENGLAPFSFSSRSALFKTSLSVVELSPIDTMPAMRTRPLLPQNMSFMEKGLWGEDGLLRTTGLASPLTPESRMSELSLRRGMLVAHQIGGFVTLGLMASAAYSGQKIIDGNSGYRPYHSAFVTGTIITYSFTGLLSILSPPPVIRRDEFSTTTLHKTLAWVHAAGMILTPILASAISRRSPSTQKEHIHQLSGYITTAVFAASMITVTF